MIIPGKTEDYEYFLFDDGRKFPASNNLALEMHEDEHGKINYTMITETVTDGKETGYVIQDSPDIPEWTETIYTCSCGATKQYVVKYSIKKGEVKQEFTVEDYNYEYELFLSDYMDYIGNELVTKVTMVMF